jgi:hypothetical protein
MLTLGWTLRLSAHGTGIQLDSGGTTPISLRNITWTAGQWHHIAVTYSESQSILFVDGTQLGGIGNGISSLNSLPTSDQGVRIGSDGGSQTIDGVLAELETFNYELSSADVLNHYNRDSDGDGLFDWQEFLLGTDPLDPDSDSDGVTDFADFYPMDPNRSQAPPTSNPANTVPPVINLLEPLNAYQTFPPQ